MPSLMALTGIIAKTMQILNDELHKNRWQKQNTRWKKKKTTNTHQDYVALKIHILGQLHTLHDCRFHKPNIIKLITVKYSQKSWKIPENIKINKKETQSKTWRLPHTLLSWSEADHLGSDLPPGHRLWTQSLPSPGSTESPVSRNSNRQHLADPWTTKCAVGKSFYPYLAGEAWTHSKITGKVLLRMYPKSLITRHTISSSKCTINHFAAKLCLDPLEELKERERKREKGEEKNGKNRKQKRDKG